MSELSDLYQQLIIDHGRKPRNFHACPHANHKKDGYNPLCGDKITLYVDEKDGVIKDVCFEGAGCAISMASASLMTEALKGKTVVEALQMFEEFQNLVTANDPAQFEEAKRKLGKLAALAGVAEYPMRVKCATLAWHTLKAALTENNQAKEKVTTE
jgi:nitrogen fixation NifU-like protein